MFASRVLCMGLKKTTGIVGLRVNPAARQDLIALYKKTLEEIKIIPEDAFYRSSVESITKYRMKVVEENEDEETIEKEINCGQLEELIEQAEDELYLIPKYHKWCLWEPPTLDSDEEEMHQD